MNNIIEKDYIIFDTRKIHIIVDDVGNIWFNAREVATSLDYKDPADVIKKLVEKSNKTKFETLKDFTTIKRDPRMIYINEGGLYTLLFSSKQPKAKIFKKWIIDEVVPSIRETNTYELKEKYNQRISELMKNINQARQNKLQMRKNMNPDKYPDGGYVYAIDFTENGQHAYKIGKTNNMTKRKSSYDSHSFHKKDVVIKVKTNDPSQLENILRESLKKYKYKDKKDVYLCDLKLLNKKFKEATNYIKKLDEDDEMRGGGDELYEEVKELKRKVKQLDRTLKELKKKKL